MTADRATPLARAAFAVLVIAGFLAFFYSQEVKRRPALLIGWTRTDVRFPRPGSRFAHFHVTATVSGPLSATIVSDRTGRAVDVVVTRARRYRRAQVSWSGRTAAGNAAPPGGYRVEVRVSGASAPVALHGLTLTLEAPA